MVSIRAWEVVNKEHEGPEKGRLRLRNESELETYLGEPSNDARADLNRKLVTTVRYIVKGRDDLGMNRQCPEVHLGS